MHSVLRGALLLSFLVGCTEQVERPPIAEDKPKLTRARGPWPDQTALISVLFFPDGTMKVDQVSPRPIAFRTPSDSFDPKRHGTGEAPKAAKDPNVPATDPATDLGSDSDAPMSRRTGIVGAPNGIQTEQPDVDLPQHQHSGAAAIVVRHASRKTPFVVPIDIGQPGEGGGDVADRWQNGGAILRAPYFGEGTTFTIIRDTTKGPQILTVAR